MRKCYKQAIICPEPAFLTGIIRLHARLKLFRQLAETKRNSLAVVFLLLIAGLTLSPIVLGQAVTITTNKTRYLPNDLLTVSGSVSAEGLVIVDVVNPYGVLVAAAQAATDNAGNYTIVVLRFPAAESVIFPVGDYAVSVTAVEIGAVATTTVRFDRDLTIATDKTTYSPNDLITVFGEAPSNDEIVVQVLNPIGNLVATGQTSASAEGNYEITPMRFPPVESDLFPAGIYQVRATAASAGVTKNTTVTFAGTEAQLPYQTRLSLNQPKTPVLEDETITFTGRLVRDDTGAGLIGQTIEILEYDGTDFCLLFCGNSTLASGITDSQGFFSIPWMAYCEDNENPCNLEISAKFEGTSDYKYSIGPSGWYDIEIISILRTTLTLDPPPLQVQAGDTVTFTGRLVREDTGVGLGGATIYIYDYDQGVFGELDDLLASGITNSDGRFAIPWIAQEADTQDDVLEIYAWFAGTPQYEASQSPFFEYYLLEVTSAKLTTTLTLEPPPSRVATGDAIMFNGRLIRDDTGEGISDATIYIYDYDQGDFGEQDDLLASGLTDRNGYFNILWFAEPELEGEVAGQEVYAWFPGTTELGPSKAPLGDYYSVIVTAVGTTLSLGQPPSPIQTRDEIIFGGRLTRDDTGAGIGAQAILIQEYDGTDNCLLFCGNSTLASGITDSQGFFSIPWMAYCEDNENPCNLEVFAMFGGSLSYGYSIAPSGWHDIEVVTTIGTLLTLDPLPDAVEDGTLVSFSGRLVRADRGVGIGGATIYIYDYDLGDFGILDDFIASGITNPDGYFQISWFAEDTDVQDDVLELYAWFPGTSEYSPSKGPGIDYYFLEVTSSLVPTLLTLEPPPLQVREGDTIIFTGRLVTVESGAGISNNLIQIFDYDQGAFGEQDDLLASGLTDSNGYFAISWVAKPEAEGAVQGQEVYAWFQGTPEYESSKAPATDYYNLIVTPPTFTTALALERPPPSVRTGDIVTFTGRLVNNETGFGISGGTIYIFDYDQGAFGEQDDLLGSGLTDRNGYFTIIWIAEAEPEGTVPGQEIYAWFPGSSEYGSSKAPVMDYYSVEVLPLDTIPPRITVSHDPVQIHVEQTITLTVTSHDGSEGSGVGEVRLYVDSSLVQSWSGNGTFRFEGGPYSVGAHTYYAIATDNDGNIGTDPLIGVKTFVVTIDELKSKTLLTLEPISLDLLEGSDISFNGRLIEVATGNAIPNVIIMMLDFDGDTFDDDLLAFGLTDSNGVFNIPWNVSCTDTHQDPCIMEIYGQFGGTLAYEPSRAPETGFHNLQAIGVEINLIGEVACFGRNCERAQQGIQLLGGLLVNGSVARLPGIELEIFWEGGSQVTYTDLDGRYEFRNIPLYGTSGRHELRIEARLTDNKFIRILDCSQSCYLPRSYWDQYVAGELFKKEIYIFPSNVALQRIEPILFSSVKETDAASIYLYNKMMADFYSDVLGVNLESERPIDINIYVPREQTDYSYYWPSQANRHIVIRYGSSPSVSSTWKDTVGMEYTHYVHFVFGAGSASNVWMIENFGNFMPEAISAELGDQAGVGFFSTLCRSIESGATSQYRDPTDTLRDSPTYDWWGIYCPMASILWDFYDHQNTFDDSRMDNEDDSISIPLRLIWEILSSRSISNLEEIYRILMTVDIDQNGIVDSRDAILVESIFAAHGAPGGQALN